MIKPEELFTTIPCTFDEIEEGDWIFHYQHSSFPGFVKKITYENGEKVIHLIDRIYLPEVIPGNFVETVLTENKIKSSEWLLHRYADHPYGWRKFPNFKSLFKIQDEWIKEHQEGWLKDFFAKEETE